MQVVDSGAWSSWVDITLDLDALNLDYGIHTFNCVASDINSNLNFSTITITVNDTQNPELYGPTDINYIFGATGIIASWMAYDEAPNQYWVTGLASSPAGTWEDGVSIDIDVSGLTVGSHLINMTVNDTKGNEANSTVNVTVLDVQPPHISQPMDVYYKFGEGAGKAIYWYPERGSFDPSAYTIYQNNTKVDSDNWTESVFINWNIDSLAVGLYYFIIVLNDTQNYTTYDQVKVTVYENVAPVIIGPNDLTYDIGTTSNTLEWNITDANPNSYNLYKDGAYVTSASWYDAVNVTRNVDGLGIGSYEFELVAYDDYGNNASDIVWVTVEDNSNPEISTNDTLIFYLEGTTGHSITWYADDSSKSHYYIYQNGTIVDANIWSTATIVYNIDGLAVGAYNFTAIVYDAESNTNSSESIVIVYESTPPTINNPPEMIYEWNHSSHFINWTANDANPFMYEIENSTGYIVESGAWDGSMISFNVSYLPIGNHTYKCKVIDKFMNNASSNARVIVTPLIAPSLSHPVDINYESGQTGNNISWIAYDLSNPSNAFMYEVLNNSVPYTSGAWTDFVPISVDIDNLLPGLYNFTIIVNDTDGNVAIDTVNVTVTSGPPPVFTGIPTDKGLIEGSTGNFIIWQANSTSQCENYTIYLDSVQVKFGNWTDNQSISYLIDDDSLAAGIYYYVLRVYNIFGFAEDEVRVEIVDVTDPIISDLPDVEYIEGSTGNELVWTTSDLHPDTYRIYVDYGSGYVLEDVGTWDTNVTFDIDGFPYGTNVLFCEVFDEEGNSNYDIVIVTVKDVTAPIFSSPLPGSYISDYPEGTEFLWAVWNAYDTHPMIYEILINGSIVSSGPWSGSSIIHNVGGLAYGTHNFTCIIYDQDGNNASNSFIVNVLDNSNPILSQPDDFTYEEDSIYGTYGVSIAWSCWDVNPDTYIIYKTSSPGVAVKNGSYFNGETLFIETGPLTAGVYNYTIVVNDTTGNTAMDMVWVTVTSVSAPQIISPPDLVMYEDDSATIYWNFSSAEYPLNYSIEKDGFGIANGSWDGSDISYFIGASTLPNGSYEYNLTVFNNYSGVSSDLVNIIVLESAQVPPTFNGTDPASGFTYTEGTTGHFIKWMPNVTMNKLDPTCKYVITLFPVGVVATGPFNDSSSLLNITLNIDGLSSGAHYYTCMINNTDGLTAESQFIVNVVDNTPPLVWVDQSYISYGFGTTPPVLTWHASDAHPYRYEITMGYSYIDGDFWYGDDILYNVSDIPIPGGLPIGYYILTLKAFDTSGNMAYDRISVEVTDSQPPTFGGFDYLPTTILEGENALVSVSVYDYNLRTVDLYANYTLANGTVIYQNRLFPMTPNPSPEYRTIIPTSTYDQDGNITFFIVANDTAGNSIIVPSDSPCVIQIIRNPDINPPIIWNQIIQSDGADKDINISARVVEDRGLDSVWANIWVWNYTSSTLEEYSSLNMTNLQENIYNYTFSSAYFGWNDSVYIRIYALDGGGNFAELVIPTLTLTMGTPPNIHEPTEVEGADFIEITVEVENADNVHINFQNNSNNWTNAPMASIGSDFYRYQINATQYGYYNVWAESSGATAQSSTRFYYIGEIYEFNFTVPLDKIVGQNFLTSLSINNTSPFSEFSTITMILPTGISLYDGRMVTNTMIFNNTVGIFDWKLIGSIPGDYQIQVNVSSDLFPTVTLIENIAIYEDNSPPIIGDVIFDGTPGVGEVVTVSTTIVDNVKVDTAQILWTTDLSIPFTQWNVTSMSVIGSIYTADIPGQANGTDIAFAIRANDTNSRVVVKNNYGTYYLYTVTTSVDIQINVNPVVNLGELFKLNITIHNKKDTSLDTLIDIHFYLSGSTTVHLTQVAIPSGFTVISTSESIGHFIIGANQTRAFESWTFNSTQIGLYVIEVDLYEGPTSLPFHISKTKLVQIIEQEDFSGTGSGELDDVDNDFNLNVSFRFPTGEDFEAWMSFFGTNPAGDDVAGNGSLVGSGFYEFSATIPLIEGVLCIPFNMSAIMAQGIDPTTLTISYFDEENQTWVPVEIGWLVQLSGDIWLACANISHFSFYAIIGEHEEGGSPPGSGPGPVPGALPDFTFIIIIIVAITAIAGVAILTLMRRRKQAEEAGAGKVKDKDKVTLEVVKAKEVLPENMCAHHKGEIEGLKYTCPECKTNFCIKCSEKLLKEKKACSECNTPMNYYTIKKLGREQRKIEQEERRKLRESQAQEAGAEKIEVVKEEPDKGEPFRRPKKQEPKKTEAKKKTKDKKKEEPKEEAEEKNYYRLRRKKAKQKKTEDSSNQS